MKKIILFNFICIISMNIHAQNCNFSEEAKHHWRRANAIIDNLKTSENYESAIVEFEKLIILAPDCSDVYYNLFVLYSQWAKLSDWVFDLSEESNITPDAISVIHKAFEQLNAAEIFLKVYIVMYSGDKEEYRNQLAKLEIKRANLPTSINVGYPTYNNAVSLHKRQIGCKYKDFLDYAYQDIKAGNNEFAERFYQLHKFISREFVSNRDKFEKYVEMAYSANSFYEKEEYQQAKQIYEEMLTINSEDTYVKERYDACLYYTLSFSEKEAIFQTIFDNMVYVQGSKSVKSFYISRYELTQKQWNAVMGFNPSKFSGCDDCPVENVTRRDIIGFIEEIRQETGKKYRLPTWYEWEYAWSGGKKSKKYEFSGSNDINTVAWYKGNSEDKTHPVGLKQCNELGLYDMTGNVSEVCSDYSCWGSAYHNNPFPNSNGDVNIVYDSDRLIIGGGNSKAGGPRGGMFRSGGGDSYVGFRLCLDAE